MNIVQNAFKKIDKFTTFKVLLSQQNSKKTRLEKKKYFVYNMNCYFLYYPSVFFFCIYVYKMNCRLMYTTQVYFSLLSYVLIFEPPGLNLPASNIAFVRWAAATPILNQVSVCK